MATETSRVAAPSWTRNTRVVPGVSSPSACVIPSAASIVLMLRTFAVVVPMPTICVPRSIPAAKAGAPSNASITVIRVPPPSSVSRKPKPAVEPELKNAFSSAMEVRYVKNRSRCCPRAVAVSASI